MPVIALLQRFDTVLEALEKGQPVDLSGMPPAPDGQSDNGAICLGWIREDCEVWGWPDTLPTLLLWVPRSEGPSTGF